MAENPLYRAPAPTIDHRIVPNKEALGCQNLRVSGARRMCRLIVIPVQPMDHYMRFQAPQVFHEQVQLLKDTVTHGAGIDDASRRTAPPAKDGLEASRPSLRIVNTEAEREGITERKNDGRSPTVFTVPVRAEAATVDVDRGPDGIDARLARLKGEGSHRMWPIAHLWRTVVEHRRLDETR